MFFHQDNSQNISVRPACPYLHESVSRERADSASIHSLPLPSVEPAPIVAMSFVFSIRPIRLRQIRDISFHPCYNLFAFAIVHLLCMQLCVSRKFLVSFPIYCFLLYKHVLSTNDMDVDCLHRLKFPHFLHFLHKSQ